MRVIVRGWGDGALIFEDELEMNDPEDAPAPEHIDRVVQYEKHLLEIEFPDEPDPLQRFYRFGTDPSRMVQPVRLEIGGLIFWRQDRRNGTRAACRHSPRNWTTRRGGST